MSTLPILRSERPRLYRAPDDPAFAFPTPRDPVRRRILRNVLADANALAARRPVRALPVYPDSPHPFHQLYVTFFAGMEATALIEQYSFAWRMTRDVRWLKLARLWLQAAVRWEHSDRVEEHFYTANRYMQALAVALDWLAGALTEAEERSIVQCLIKLMERWWPDVHAQRRSQEGGHHADELGDLEDAFQQIGGNAGRTRAGDGGRFHRRRNRLGWESLWQSLFVLIGTFHDPNESLPGDAGGVGQMAESSKLERLTLEPEETEKGMT